MQVEPRCYYGLRIYNKTTGITECLGCKDISQLSLYSSEFVFLTTHDLVRGPYDPPRCSTCREEVIACLPYQSCKICAENFLRISNYLDLTCCHSIRAVNRVDPDVSCLRCCGDYSRRDSNFTLQISHSLIRGPYSTQYCSHCRRNLIQEFPVTSCVTYVLPLIGFDCGGQHLNITSVSLLGAGECNINLQTPNSTNVYIQLLQLSDYHFTEVQRCLHMFTEGTLPIGNSGDVIDQIKPNRTTSRSVTLAGTIRHDGYCKGAQYSVPYGTWDDVIVQAVVRITLKSSFVPVKLGSGKIILKSGTVCDLSNGFCLDSEDGYSYWKPMPTSSCNLHQYDVLYEGPSLLPKPKNSRSAVTPWRERNILSSSSLSFATLRPDEFAYRLTKGPGYMAVTAGEAVHVIKCIPVKVLVRKTEACYIELPLFHGNTSPQDDWLLAAFIPKRISRSSGITSCFILVCYS